MLIHAWLLLVVLTSFATGATIARRVGLVGALIGIVGWLVAGFGALELEVPVDGANGGTTLTFAEPSIAYLTAMPAVVLLPIAYLAAVGRWQQDDSDPDRPDSGLSPRGLDELRRQRSRRRREHNELE